MPKHIITRSYDNLKGFSTDSIYLRPPYVSSEAINLHRDPDGTFTPRRGYQCEISDIGGLGITSFDNPCRCGIELVCVSRDGNLYRRLTNQIHISFNSSYSEAWFQFNIFTNPNIFNNSPGWSFEPWSLTPWSIPNGESITFNGIIQSAAIANGDQSNVTTLIVHAGHVVQVGNQITVMDVITGTNETRTVTAIGPTSITYSGGTLSVLNNSRINVFIEQLFGRGFDVPTAYTISDFISLLNTINGITAYIEGPSNFPAAFIPIQEFEILISGSSTTLEYFYWEKIPTPVNPTLPGSASVINQSSSTFENANFCVFDEILYCTNGYDYPVKYDGQNVYLAGMPKGDRPIVTKAGNGDLTANDIYYYAITYEQKDNANHVLEGEISNSYEYKVGATAETTNVKINNLDSNSRYNTNVALASGSTSVTYGPDLEGNYYQYVGTLPGQSLLIGDTAYYQDRAIAMVNWSGSPVTGTLLRVDSGYGVIVGDIVTFLDNGGVTRRRRIVDIDTTVTPNLLEIDGDDVDTSNNPALSSYIEGSVYGHIGIVNGDQANTTLINLLQVLAPLAENTLTVGELITFTDVNGDIVKRTVVNRTSTSITVDFPVSVEDGILITGDIIDDNLITIKTIKLNPILTTINDPISNNLKINVYRSKGSSDGSLTELFLLDSIPNNSTSLTQTYMDNLSDDELNLQNGFANPVQLPNPPPKCKYIFTYQNMVIYAGGSRYPQDTQWSLDAFYFSKGNEPEAVPAATNFQLVPSNDDIISGVSQSGTSLIIGKDRSIYAISGDLLTSQFQVIAIAPGSNIGVAAHATMVSKAGLLYFLHTNGVYCISETQMIPTDSEGDPIPISKTIDVLFRTKPFEKNKQFVFKRAIGVNFTTDNEFWLFMPCEDENGIRNANPNSVVLCYDYEAQNWFSWDNINSAGGFAMLGDNIYWQERRFSGVIGNTSNLYRQHRNYRLIDYADHTRPIRVFWASGWEDLKYPQVRKKFIRAMLLFDRIDSLYQLNQPYLFFSTYLDRFPNKRDTYAPVTTVNNSVKWGSSWSWRPWAGVVDPFIRINLKNGTQAKSLQISLEMNQLNTSFKFNGFQLEISPEYAKTFVR